MKVAERSKISVYALISVLLLFLLASNSSSIFFTQVPFPARVQPEKTSFLTENVTRKSKKLISLQSSVLYSVTEENPGGKLETHLPILHKNRNLATFTKEVSPLRRRRRKRHRRVEKVVSVEVKVNRFEAKVLDFLNSSCEFRFFMTWISSVESFGAREIVSVESLFRTHPNGCLLIASTSLDSKKGIKILRPFVEKGFKVKAFAPDFNFLFKYTAAEVWYKRLKQGNVDPGEVPLGQNLSNLLRLGLLYRFGGIYIDTDVLVLKSFGGLRNVIGAQTIDLDTKNWSRLNNAVMVFDEAHPLVYKFIEEFALTFDGNKWGHNGPYLVSRVVSRLLGRQGFEFRVLDPSAFYPVNWSRIGSLFEGPKNLLHSKWLLAKLRKIRSESFAVHLWNKQSRGLEVLKGSIVEHMMLSSCVLCSNYSNAVM